MFKEKFPHKSSLRHQVKLSSKMLASIYSTYIITVELTVELTGEDFFWTNLRSPRWTPQSWMTRQNSKKSACEETYYTHWLEGWFLRKNRSRDNPLILTGQISERQLAGKLAIRNHYKPDFCNKNPSRENPFIFQGLDTILKSMLAQKLTIYND